MRRILLAAVAAMMVAPAVQAQQLLDAYVAYIGRDDLYNSRGARLTEPWQVLRQDRANYHRFGVRQRGDEGDSFFGSIDNRAIMERMVMNGYIEPSAARALVNGGSTVFVRIYRDGGRDYVQVRVAN